MQAFPEIKKIKNAKTIADDYAFSGGQIENIARKSQIESILEGTTPDFEMLCTFCDEESLSKPKNTIIGFKNHS